jgi:hypothetical protein
MSQWTQGVGQRRLWKAEEFDGLKPNVYDWVRMAAFLDGEGNMNINPITDKRRSFNGGLRYQVRILIGNTNPALPVWLRETFGGNIVLRNSQLHNPRAKQSYIWSCTSARAAWILQNCLPWFLLKLAQAKLLITLQEEIDTTRQGRNKFVAPERLVRRQEIKDQLHKLNAKGCDNQIVIKVEDL